MENTYHLLRKKFPSLGSDNAGIASPLKIR
jgi:hypothetical protein